MLVYDKVFVDGAWTESTSSTLIDVVDASTEQVVARVVDGTPADVDRAVAAAQSAFPSWSQAPLAERVKAVSAIADGLQERAEELARTISSEVGMPIALSRVIQAGMPIMNARLQAQLVQDLVTETTLGNSLVLREPIGVVGAITPWNYPLHQVINKVVPAIAVGCTVVLKPSEVAPLSAFILAQVIEAVGLPPGVFNLVCGSGAVAGEALVAHPGVDMVSFTGSTRAGTLISEVAAQTVKRVALELGGKSANILLDDADFATEVPAGLLGGCYLNSGQTCTALTRMLVPRDRQEEVVELAKRAAEAIHVGRADSDAQLGPLISAAQRDRVRRYIQTGIAQGARLVTGGVEPPDGLPVGYFVRPTVFADVRPDMTIAQEEIFGPVLSIIPYDTEDEAVEIANDTVYGLAGAVRSADPERALRVARRLRTGQVAVNDGAFNLQAPFGGYRRSGNGRELGEFGLQEFLEIKSIQLPADHPVMTAGRGQ